MKKYELVLIDADDTLFDYHKGEEMAFERSCINFGIDYKKDHHLKLYQEINFKIWREFEEKKISAEDLKPERFRRLFEKLGAEISPQEFSDYYLETLGEADFLLDGAKDLSKYLFENYKLVLITNGLSKVQRSRIGRSEIAEYYQNLIISEEVGVPKPEPGIYEKSMEAVNHTDKKNTIIIGDNIGSDIKGGINFGIDTCWFNLNNSVKPEGINPTYEITSLDELYKIL